MLDISRLPDGYLQERLAYSERVAEHLSEGHTLPDQLSYLGNYACHGDSEKTRCILFTDFAPHSFYFHMEKKNAEGEYEYWFNGGCTFYSPGDSGVGSPQFSVHLGGTVGWTINT